MSYSICMKIQKKRREKKKHKYSVASNFKVTLLLFGWEIMCLAERIKIRHKLHYQNAWVYTPLSWSFIKKINPNRVVSFIGIAWGNEQRKPPNLRQAILELLSCVFNRANKTSCFFRQYNQHHHRRHNRNIKLRLFIFSRKYDVHSPHNNWYNRCQIQHVCTN